MSISPNLIRVLVSTPPDLLAELLVAGKVLDAEVISTFQDRAMLAFGRGIRLEVALQAALQAGQKVKLQVQPGEPGGPLVLRLVQAADTRSEGAPAGGSPEGRQPSLPSQPRPGLGSPAATGYPGPSGQAAAEGQGGAVVQARPQGQASPAGDSGTQGQAFSAGAKSQAGTAAPASEQGQTAPANPPGPQGQAGVAVPPGPQGQAGAAVPPGLQGQAGAAVPSGPQGQADAAVPPGLQGQAGAADPPGLQGQTGAIVTNGPQGQAGATVSNGEEVARPVGGEGQADAARPAGALDPPGTSGSRGRSAEMTASGQTAPAPGASLPQADGSRLAAGRPAAEGSAALPRPEGQAAEAAPVNGQAELIQNRTNEPAARPDGAAPSAPGATDSARLQQAVPAAPAHAPLAQARPEPGVPPLFWLPIPLPDGKQGWAQLQVDPEEGKRRSEGGVNHQIRLWWDTPALGVVEVTLDAAQQNLTALFTVLSGAVRQGVEVSLSDLQRRLNALGFQEVRVGCRQAMPGEAIAPVSVDGGSRLDRRL